MIPLVLFLTGILGCHAAPSNYDQRQEGDKNIQVGLENFLFVFLTKGSLLDDLTFLDFKSMAKQIESLGDKDNEDTESIIVLGPEELRERSKTRKPYQVDIVKIPKDKEQSSDINVREQNQLENKELPKKAREDDDKSDIKNMETASKASGSS